MNEDEAELGSMIACVIRVCVCDIISLLRSYVGPGGP